MTETPAMSQDNFVQSTDTVQRAPADFSSDESALAYAEGELDKLVEAMRYSLRKQIVGWPGDDRELNTYEALRHLLRNMSFGHAAHVEADYGSPTLTKMGGTNRIQVRLRRPTATITRPSCTAPTPIACAATAGPARCSRSLQQPFVRFRRRLEDDRQRQQCRYAAIRGGARDRCRAQPQAACRSGRRSGLARAARGGAARCTSASTTPTGSRRSRQG